MHENYLKSKKKTAVFAKINVLARSRTDFCSVISNRLLGHEVRLIHALLRYFIFLRRKNKIMFD